MAVQLGQGFFWVRSYKKLFVKKKNNLKKYYVCQSVILNK